MSPAFARRLGLLCLVLALTTPQSAFAYLDPNTGGLMFQVFAPLVAMISSAFFLARDYLRALWRRILRLSPCAKPEANDPSASADRSRADDRPLP